MIKLCLSSFQDGAPPKIVQPPQTEVAFVPKGTVMLNCVATGDPAPVVMWYDENDKVLSNNTVMQIFSNGSLLFIGIKKKYAGHYRCIATNIYKRSKFFKSELVVACK